MLKVRDKRRRNFFTIDNIVADMKLSIYALGVYTQLCRHANNDTQACSLTIDVIAEKLTISRTSSKEALKELEDKGLIERAAGSGRYSPNVYYLVNLDEKTASQTVVIRPPEDVPDGRIATTEGVVWRPQIQILNTNTKNSITAASPPESVIAEVVTSPSLGLGFQLTPVVESPDAILEAIHNRYIAKMGTLPKFCRFTDKKRKAAERALNICLAKAGGDMDRAREYMEICVDQLAGSDFHRQNGYTDWCKHLFKDEEKIEFWLNRSRIGRASA